MYKWILLILLCFGFFSCVSNKTSNNDPNEVIDHSELGDEVNFLNPYKYYNLEKRFMKIILKYQTRKDFSNLMVQKK